MLLTETRRHQLSGSLVALLLAYVFGLCGQCSLVHADSFRQQLPESHPSVKHCRLPSAEPQAAYPLPAETDHSSQPECCELMNADKAFTPSPIPTVPLLVLSMAYVAQAVESRVPGVSPTPLPWVVRSALALAVLLVAISGAGWWWKRSEEQTPYTAITQALVADHIHYTHALDPLEITSADPATVSAWFQDRVPFAVRILQLSHGRLLGGRRCSPLGRLGAAVFYERDGRRVSLFTLALDVLPPEERKELQMDGEKRPKCVETGDQYVLCLACAEDAVRAVVAEGPEAGDIARMLFAGPDNMINVMENRL